MSGIAILPEIFIFSSLVASQHFETYKRRVNIMILFRNRELFVSKLQKKEKKNTDRKNNNHVVSFTRFNKCLLQTNDSVVEKNEAKFLSAFK